MDELNKILPRPFFARSTLIVARELIGARLVRILDGERLVSIITEAEAYVGEDDLGCHAKSEYFVGLIGSITG